LNEKTGGIYWKEKVNVQGRSEKEEQELEKENEERAFMGWTDQKAKGFCTSFVLFSFCSVFRVMIYLLLPFS
jgi:hypothetical protein